MTTSALASLIRHKLPDAVVRDDQCDVLRVAWQQRTAYAERHEAGFQVRVYLCPTSDSSDSVPEPHLADFAIDTDEAAAKVVFWLKRVAETSIDRY